MSGWTLALALDLAWGWAVSLALCEERGAVSGAAEAACKVYTSSHSKDRVCLRGSGTQPKRKQQQRGNLFCWPMSLSDSYGQSTVPGTRIKVRSCCWAVLCYGPGINSLVLVPGNLWLSGEGLAQVSTQGSSCQQADVSLQSLSFLSENRRRSASHGNSAVV